MPTAKPIVLVVDDDEGAREALHLVLEDDFDVVMAPDGPTALHTVRTGPVDAVLLDILLRPGPDGVRVLREIKQLRPTLPTIVFSAAPIEDLERLALSQGAYAFAHKPWDEAWLLRTLHDAVAGRPRPRWVLLLDGPGPVRWAVTALLGGRDEIEGVDRDHEYLSAKVAAPTLTIVGSSLATPDTDTLLGHVATYFPGSAVLLTESAGQSAPTVPPALELWGRCPYDIPRIVEHATSYLWPLEAKPDLRGLPAEVAIHLANHYAEPLTVARVAQGVGYSESQIAHRLRERAHLSIKEMLDRIRAAAATHLLRTTRLTTERIAEQVGVSDAANLTRLMQRVTGRSPSALRHAR
jgi:Response regulator containing CheY-like receiver, AAA-type ATPase, and DNA-binding domains